MITPNDRRILNNLASELQLAFAPAIVDGFEIELIVIDKDPFVGTIHLTSNEINYYIAVVEDEQRFIVMRSEPIEPLPECTIYAIVEGFPMPEIGKVN